MTQLKNNLFLTIRSMQIELTQEEARALIQLIDLAVKSGGLNTAQAGLVLANKINSALTVKPEVKPAEKVE